MRRSLETEREHAPDAPLLNARPAVPHETDTIVTRELNAPETQLKQTAALATRNPNAIVALPPTPPQLAVKAQVAEAIAQRQREQQKRRVIERVFTGDGGPYQWHTSVFETFAYALASGMATETALQQATRNAPPQLQAVFADIIKQVEQGATLVQALKTHQEQLPDIVVPIFEHGLIYGSAENTARQTAKALQKLASIETKFEYSALNPGFVMPLVAGGIMLLALVPIAFLCANPLVPYTLFCTVMLGGSALGWKLRHKLAGRKLNHKILSKMGLNGWGKGFVRRQMGSARWSRTFAALWHCGVPISSALEAAGRSTRNAHYERILCDAAQSTRNGVSLSDSLARAGLLKGEMINTIRTGETTGDLGPALEQWAEVLEDDAKQRGAQLFFLHTFGRLFVAALIIFVLALIFAYSYAGRPLPIE